MSCSTDVQKQTIADVTTLLRPCEEQNRMAPKLYLSVLDTDFLMHKENFFHKSSPTFLEPFQKSVKQVAATKCAFLPLGVL